MLSSCVKADVIEEIRFKPQFHEDYIFWKEIISKIPEGSIFSDKIPNSVISSYLNNYLRKSHKNNFENYSTNLLEDLLNHIKNL